MREVLLQLQVHASVKQGTSQALDEALRVAFLVRIQVFRFGQQDQTVRQAPRRSHAEFTWVHQSQQPVSLNGIGLAPGKQLAEIPGPDRRVE